MTALLWTQLSSAIENSPKQSTPTWVKLPTGVTNVTKWADNALAAFDSSTGRVLELPRPGSSSTALDLLLDLDLPPSKDSGTAFPNPLLRSPSGELYLLNKGHGEIFVFDRDGKLARRIESPFPSNHHMALADGRPLVVGHCSARDCAGSAIWNGSGWSKLRPSWLLPRKNDNRFTAAFVFPPSQPEGGWIELLYYFPWIRHVRSQEEKSISYTDCEAVPDFVRASIEAQALERGIPMPIGDGFRGDGSLYPVLFGADREGSDVYGILNGRAMIHLSTEDMRIDCAPAPEPPQECSPAFLTSLAVDRTVIALLYRCTQSGDVWVATINR